MAGVLQAIRILAAAGFGLGAAGAAAAESITLEGITFSDALGGIELIGGWGRGTPEDPFVVVEVITDDGPAILTIRGLDVDFGNRIASHHLAGFKLTKIVCNGTGRDWLLFDLELRERLRDYSPYEDGLSFGQGSIAGRPFLSDTFDYAEEISEPFDKVSFSGGTVPPGGTVAFTVVITDSTPRPVFYLLQKREKPIAEWRDRPQGLLARVSLARTQCSFATGPS
ncbi:MAG: hypothetical protein V3S27_09640 [Kiloniellales bacterium]